MVGPSPHFRSHINQKPGRGVSLPRCWKERVRGQQMPEKGSGTGWGVSPSGCYQEVQAGPKTEEEGMGPLKGPVLTCDGWGAGESGRSSWQGAAPHQAQERCWRPETPPSVCRPSLGLTLPGKMGSLKPPGTGMSPTGIPTGGDGSPQNSSPVSSYGSGSPLWPWSGLGLS